MVGGHTIGDPEGGSDNWESFSLTTNATANTEDNHAYSQTILNTIIINDGDSPIEFGFGASTSSKSFVLEPGDSFFIKLVYGTLYYKSTGTSVPFRVLVTW